MKSSVRGEGSNLQSSQSSRLIWIYVSWPSSTAQTLQRLIHFINGSEILINILKKVRFLLDHLHTSSVCHSIKWNVDTSMPEILQTRLRMPSRRKILSWSPFSFCRSKLGLDSHVHRIVVELAFFFIQVQVLQVKECFCCIMFNSICTGQLGWRSVHTARFRFLLCFRFWFWFHWNVP